MNPDDDELPDKVEELEYLEEEDSSEESSEVDDDSALVEPDLEPTELDDE